MRTICLYFIYFLLLCGCTSANRNTARQTSEDTIRVINPKLQTSETLIKNLLGVEMEDFVLGMNLSDFRRMSKEQDKKSHKIDIDTTSFRYTGEFFYDSLFHFKLYSSFLETLITMGVQSEKDRKFVASFINHLEKLCGKADRYRGTKDYCVGAVWDGNDIRVMLDIEGGDYLRWNSDSTLSTYSFLVINVTKPSIEKKWWAYCDSLSEKRRRGEKVEDTLHVSEY